MARALNIAGSGFAQADPAGHRAALETLLAAGETRAALALLNVLTNQGGFGQDGGWTLTLEYGAHPALDGQGIGLLEVLRLVVANPDAGVHMPDLAAELARRIAVLDEGTGDAALQGAQRLSATLAQDAELRAKTADEVAQARLAAPLRAVCEAVCAESAATCTLAMVLGMGGVPGFLTLSPLESLAPSAVYQESPRFAADLRRRLAAGVPLLARYDACAADWAAE